MKGLKSLGINSIIVFILFLGVISSVFAQGDISITYDLDGVEKEVIVPSGTMMDKDNPEYNEFLKADVTSITSQGNTITIEYADEDLDDNGDSTDNNFASSDCSIDLGNKLFLGDDASGTDKYYCIRGTLKYDGNQDGDLKDTADYVLYTGMYSISGIADARVRLAYSKSNIMDLVGTVEEIKGTKYLFTDASIAGRYVQLGPAKSKWLPLLGPGIPEIMEYSPIIDDVVIRYFNDSGAYKLYMWKGGVLEGIVDITGLSAPADLSDMVHANSTILDNYKVWLTEGNVGDSTIEISITDENQIQRINNDDIHVLGYPLAKVADDDIIFETCTSCLFLFSDEITIPPGTIKDVPDTYFNIKFYGTKEIDVRRVEIVDVWNGSILKKGHLDYPFLKRDIKVSIVEEVQKADLIVEDISWTPVNPKVGETLRTVSIKVRNLGAVEATKINVGAYISNLQGYLFCGRGTLLSSLKPGESKTVSFPSEEGITFTNCEVFKSGTYKIKGIIDSQNLIDESNENNNEMTKTIYVAQEPCVCPDIYAPVCGVDGKTYDNECFAKCAGIKISYYGKCEKKGYSDDLDDDGDTTDNNFASSDCSIDLGNKLYIGTISDEYYCIKGTLKYDFNEDGDLKDGDDYALYTGMYVISGVSGDALVRLAYYKPDITALEGTVQNIRGIKFLFTRASSSDKYVHLGPAIPRRLEVQTIIDHADATIYTGTIKLLYIFYNGKYYLVIFDGAENQGMIDITGLSAPYDLTDPIHGNTTVLDMYKVWLTEGTGGDNTIEVTITDENQIMRISNDQMNVLGYPLAKVADDDIIMGTASNALFLFSDLITIPTSTIIDVPDTYFSIEFSSNRKIDVKRKIFEVVPPAIDFVDIEINPKSQTIIYGDEAEYEITIKDKHPRIVCIAEEFVGPCVQPLYTYQLDIINLPFKKSYPKSVTLSAGQSKIVTLEIVPYIIVPMEEEAYIEKAGEAQTEEVRPTIPIKPVPPLYREYRFNARVKLQGDPKVQDIAYAVLNIKPEEEPPITPPPFPEEEVTVKLLRGWNLVSLPGKLVKFSLDTIPSKKLLAYVYLKDEKRYVTLKQAAVILGNDLREYLAKNAFWIYTFEDFELKVEIDRELSYYGLALTQGWNLLPITEDMVGGYLGDILGDCSFERMYRWNARNQEWVKITEDYTFSEEDLNYGFIVKAPRYCRLGGVIVIPPPQINPQPPITKEVVWVNIDPIQCLGNPWEQDWLKDHDMSYQSYSKENEDEIIKKYYEKHGITVYEIRKVRTYEGACEACSCPRGDTLYLLVSEKYVEKMNELRFKVGGPE